MTHCYGAWLIPVGHDWLLWDIPHSYSTWLLRCLRNQIPHTLSPTTQQIKWKKSKTNKTSPYLLFPPKKKHTQTANKERLQVMWWGTHMQHDSSNQKRKEQRQNKTKRDRGQKSCGVLCWSLSRIFQFGPRDLQIALLALPRVRLCFVVFHLLNSVWLLRCWKKRMCVCEREKETACERNI